MHKYSHIEAAVIGGLGQSPSSILRALNFGAVLLYIPLNFIKYDKGAEFKSQLTKLAANSILLSNAYVKPHHQLNESSALWSKFEVAAVQPANKIQIASSGYGQILMHIPMTYLNPYLDPELIQNELGLPYMAIDQCDQFRSIPIWYDDYKNGTNGVIDGNYDKYPTE